MKTLTNDSINSIGIIDTKSSFNNICNSLDKQHELYIYGKMKTYSLDEVWENFLNRNNTLSISKIL